MAATFPNGIASFTQKRDLLDINYASDMNRIQDEIIAIEQTLGVLLNEVRVIESDIVDLQEEDVLLNETDDLIKQTVAMNFKTLSDQLAWIRTGAFHLAAQTGAGGSQWVAPLKAAFQSTQPSRVLLLPPTPELDPDSLWNGAGFTLKRSGFWFLQSYLRFDTTDRSDLSAAQAQQFAGKMDEGTYQAAISTSADDWTYALDRKQVTAADRQSNLTMYPNVILNPQRIGWFPAGTRVSLRASQSTELRQRVSRARLTVAALRYTD